MPVGAIGDRINGLLMSFELSLGFASCHFEYLHDWAGSHRQTFAIRTERAPGNILVFVLAFDDGDLPNILAGGGIPDADGRVAPARGDQTTVGAESNGSG